MCHGVWPHQAVKFLRGHIAEPHRLLSQGGAVGVGRLGNRGHRGIDLGLGPAIDHPSAPAAASPLAMACPMPDVDPVTSAVFPLRSIFMRHLHH